MAFPPIFVINLDRSPERWADTQAKLDAMGLSYERIAGVDGKLMSDEEYRQHTIASPFHLKWFRPVTRGELCCFLSHIKAWKTIAERNLPYAIVLEDDLVLQPNFKQAVELIINSTSQWDAVKLNNYRRPSLKLETLGQGQQQEQALELHQCLPIQATGLATIFTAEGARKLIQNVDKIVRPQSYHVKHFWEHGLVCLSLKKPIVSYIPNEDNPSDIGKRADYHHYSLANKTLTYLRKYLYHIGYRFKLMSAAGKLYGWPGVKKVLLKK